MTCNYFKVAGQLFFFRGSPADAWSRARFAAEAIWPTQQALRMAALLRAQRGSSQQAAEEAQALRSDLAEGSRCLIVAFERPSAPGPWSGVRLIGDHVGYDQREPRAAVAS